MVLGGAIGNVAASPTATIHRDTHEEFIRDGIADGWSGFQQVVMESFSGCISVNQT